MHPMETVFPSNCFHMGSGFILHLSCFDIFYKYACTQEYLKQPCTNNRRYERAVCSTIVEIEIGVNKIDHCAVSACQ